MPTCLEPPEPNRFVSNRHHLLVIERRKLERPDMKVDEDRVHEQRLATVADSRDVPDRYHLARLLVLPHRRNELRVMRKRQRAHVGRVGVQERYARRCGEVPYAQQRILA